MSKESFNLAAVAMVGSIFFFGAWVVKPIAARIGSDFWLTFYALASSLMILGLALAIAWFVDFISKSMAIAFASLISWFCWWPVLSSVACNGCDPREPPSGGLYDPYYMSAIRPDAAWIRWGIAAVLFASVVFLIFDRRRNWECRAD
ncbi:hypothetical protein [Burkholderia gladioli]|uniref:hypothetical protein n=1 Tax=Burkholderia gladioli TaxID=28095 RepID=UPI0012D2D9B0|nr:hypothetical protein [Burkholderia gladioli]